MTISIKDLALTLFGIATFASASSHAYASSTNTPIKAVDEVAVKNIPLAAPLDIANAEISGLSWCGDKLIIVPQYPERFSDDGNDDGYFFYIEKQQIDDFLSGKNTKPITSQAIALNENDLRKSMSIFDGFEAMTCDGEHAWLSIEALSFLGKYQSYVVPASISFDTNSQLNIKQDELVFLKSQSGMKNIGDEAIVSTNNGVIALHEINDERAVASPKARHVSNALGTISELSFPHIPFRITDATKLDSNNIFWAINYKYSGDKFSRAANDHLTKTFGEGASHKKYYNVERLVEFRLDGNAVSLTDTPPIALKMNSVEGRNWEGLVKLDTRGFLIATDKHPSTLLGFVPYEFDSKN